MPWPLPTPDELAERLAGGFEAAAAPFVPGGVDARSDNTVLGVLARVQANAAYLQHLHLRAIADDLHPDTAEKGRLEGHAAVWGITRKAAAAATGSVTFAGTAGTPIPVGTRLTFGAAGFVTTASGTVGAAVPVAAEVAGAAGNVVAGAVLQLVSPLAGVAPQSAVVGAAGLAGGRAAETDDSLRARLLELIRSPSRGGAATDYVVWAKRAAGVEQVSVYSGWVGLGTVGVVVAMTGGAAPSAGDLARVAAEIEAERPITASVTVVPAVPTAQPLTVQLSPDTTANRAAVTAAYAAFLAREPGIGGTIFASRRSEALSAAAGEYAHRVTSPPGDVALGQTELAVPGTITWATYS